jgi:uncharacterized protein YdhG (YjbR/CyaY superfamily)
MTKTNFKTIDEYHNIFPGDVVERMETVRALVRRIVPDAEEVISYQIPAFKIGKKYYLIYYSAYPKHLSLSCPWSENLLREFETELSGLKVSRSAIQFPHDKPLSTDLIERILKFRKEEIDNDRV